MSHLRQHVAFDTKRVRIETQHRVWNIEEVRNMAGKRGRSAVTGRFVKQSTVKRHPKTTTNESTGKRGKK
ncbi:hypothetical protein GCM10007198_12730 [Microbacterium aerolatum]|uniref:Uncharacterized protein n=1 Tax=Microbacterium aerolatum TaxID=153731 RepID=A0A511AH30_9MICO|nr:hypothetical protein MAE01_26610 [Microbacterium aerolatum]GGB23792.1 hypothetical protein GCM10007198_12730 [Microbacterium aerolatum]